MNESSGIDRLSAGIRKLDGIRALAFGICLLERAMPAFFQFQCDTGWARGGVMRAAVAQCWAVLEGHSGETANFVSVSDCERAMPDSEGSYASDYTSAAIDAVDIACNLLVYVGSGEIDLITSSVTARTDTIELFIQDYESARKANGHAEGGDSAHSILAEELDFMRADLEFISAIDEKALFPEVLGRVLGLEYRCLRLKLPRCHEPN
jgi:uncharacterized protein YjaG (DUF416 family)